MTPSADALGALKRFHRDVTRMLHDLQDLTDGAGGTGLQRLGKVAGLARVLADGLPLHLEEEETALFPALQKVFGPFGGSSQMFVAEHAELRRLFERFLAAVQDWGRDEGRLGRPAHEALKEATAGLAAALTTHFVEEDTELFPVVEEVLTGGDLRAIDEHIAAIARRGSTDEERRMTDARDPTSTPTPASGPGSG